MKFVTLRVRVDTKAQAFDAVFCEMIRDARAVLPLVKPTFWSISTDKMVQSHQPAGAAGRHKRSPEEWFIL